MGGIFVDDHPAPLDCKPCRGTGTMGDQWCMDCGGIGCDWFDRAPLFTLAHNLGVAAMLRLAFMLGDKRGLQAAWDDLGSNREDPHDMWCSNVEGRAAPALPTPPALQPSREGE